MLTTRADERRLDRVLERLVADGTLQPAQAAAVREALAGDPQPQPGSTSKAVVAAAYVGMGLVAAAYTTFLGQNWDGLSVAGRSVTLAATSALLVAAGAVFRERVESACGLAWLLAVAAAIGFGAALFSQESADEATTFLAAGLAGLVVAVPLLAIRREAPQLLSFVVPLLFVVGAVLARSDVDANVAGTVVWATGLAIAAAGIVGLLPVTEFTVALGGLVALSGAHIAGFDSVALCGVLAGVLAVGGYVVAVQRDAPASLTIATLTVATAGPRLLGEWLHDSVGAAGVLAASGLFVLAAAAAHVRMVRRS